MSGPDEAGVPLSDQTEMELRTRITELEHGLRITSRVAIAAEIGVLCLLVIMIITTKKRAAE